jgi:hypothetical protein
MGPAVCPLRVERQARAVMRHLRHKKLETTMHYIRGITLSGEEEYTVKTARADKSTTVIVGFPEKITILDARSKWDDDYMFSSAISLIACSLVFPRRIFWSIQYFKACSGCRYFLDNFSTRTWSMDIANLFPRFIT